MNREKKIPTLVALLLILFLVVGLTAFTNYYLRVKSNAASNLLPQQAKVTTVTDNGFVVTWYTEKPTAAAVTVTDLQGTKQTFFDERHIVGDTKKYTMHSVPVRGLLANSNYSLEFIVDGKKHSIPEFTSVKTGPSLSTESNGIQPVYGSAFAKDNTPAEGALVFLQFENTSQTVSTLVKSSGSWIIPLNLLRTQDLQQLIPKSSERQTIIITIDYNGEKTQIQTDSLNASPVPPVTIGNTYDFKNQQASKKMVEEKSTASSFATVLGTQSTSTASVQLLTPKKGSHIPGERPLFSGKGVPGNLVTLILGLTNIKTESVRVAEDGLWQFTPPYKLGIGDQRVTMSTIDETKKPVAVTHLFEIMKSGTQVLGDATPSASPTEEITPEVTPTEIIEEPTPTPEVPTTATVAPTTYLIIAGFVLLFGGLIFLAL